MEVEEEEGGCGFVFGRGMADGAADEGEAAGGGIRDESRGGSVGVFIRCASEASGRVAGAVLAKAGVAAVAVAVGVAVVVACGVGWWCGCGCG